MNLKKRIIYQLPDIFDPKLCNLTFSLSPITLNEFIRYDEITNSLRIFPTEDNNLGEYKVKLYTNGSYIVPEPSFFLSVIDPP